MKTMQPLTTESGQVYVHEPCADYMTPLAWREDFGPPPSTFPPEAPRCECGRPGPWLKIYVEREAKK